MKKQKNNKALTPSRKLPKPPKKLPKSSQNYQTPWNINPQINSYLTEMNNFVCNNTLLNVITTTVKKKVPHSLFVGGGFLVNGEPGQ